MTQVLGTQGLQSKLAQIGELAVGHGLMEIALAGGFVVEGAMKKNIRAVDFVDTGATLDSTQARPVGGGTTEAEVAVGRRPTMPFMANSAPMLWGHGRLRGRRSMSIRTRCWRRWRRQCGRRCNGRSGILAGA